MPRKNCFGEPDRVRIGSRQSGFTLVELLVVLMIIGLGSGLVGPVIFKVYNQLRMKIESERVAGKIELASARAFFQQQERKIKINHERLQVMPDKIVFQLQFQPEDAAAKEILVNKAGLIAEEFKIIEQNEDKSSGKQERFYTN